MSQERSLIKERTESLGLNAIIGNQLQQYGATPRRDGKPLPPPPSKVSRTQTSITSDLNPADKQYYPPVPKTGRALPTPPGQANSSKASLVNSNTNLNSTNNGHSSVNFTHYGGVASGANSLKKASIRTPPPIPQHLRRPSDLTGENRLSSDNLPPAPEPPTPPPASAKPFQPKKEVEKEAAPVITVPKPKVDPEIVERYAHPTEDQEIAAIICQTYWRRFMAMKQLRKLKSMAYHRQKCATEILDTERFYVKNLQMIVEVYLKTFQEMAKQSNPLITAKQVSTIFSDLEVIAQFNAVFLKQLEERLTVYDPRKPLSDIFLYIAPFFKTYTRYCNNYDNALACLNQVRKNPEFMEVLGKLDKDERTSKLGLTSYLIMPIQRIPRYRLLLQDLIKHTTTDHPDYDKLNEALTKIMEVANHLNSGMRNAENANKIIAIQNQFDQENDFLVPHRRFIRDGSLTREDKEKGPQQIHLHLFNDLLVFSRKVGNNRFAFISKIELNSSAIYDFDDDDTKFQIKTPDHSFILRATPDDKQEWLRDLNAAIESSRASHSDKATLKVDVNSIRDDSSTTFALAMADDSENLTISAREAVVQMKTGSVMLKYCRNAKPHFRRFLLSADEKTFMWGSPRKNATESSVSIYDIKMVIVGQRTAIFQRYKNPDLENLSFSILYRDRTLDIVCKDKKEFIIWVEGLRFLLSRHPDEGLVVPEHVQPALSEGSDDTSSTEPVSPAAALISRTNEKKNFEEAFTRIGDAFSWGQGTRGALGHGNQSDQNSPLVMADFLYLDVIAMDCENLSAAVITATGELFTWGAGDQGKLGHGDKSDRLKPTLVKALKGSKITQVSIGAVHMLALDDNNRVYAWGGNESGQLGLGDVNPRDTPTLIEALKGKKVIKIDCGLWHSAVITDDGQLYTWGRGEDGQLGHGQATNVLSPTVVAKLRTPVSEVACGLWHTMALCDGQVYSWGNSTYGQLGHTNKDSVLEPKRIDFFVRQGKTITAIAAGSSHSGCITSIGEVYMWGNGIYGQIGNDKKDNTNDTPVHVEALVHAKVIQLVCGTNHNLALTESGKVYAWGAGTYGRLGIGSEIDQKVPTVIPNLLDKQVRNVAAGGSQSGAVCAHMWVPDKDLPHCMACKKKFTFTNRRHHCRNCGGLFCGTCTSKRLPLLRFGFNEPVRVCNNCYQILQVHQK